MDFGDGSFQFCRDILELDASVRFSCLVDSLGQVIATEYIETPFLSEKEVEQYAMQATFSALILSLFESKMGSIHYTVTYRGKVTQITLPVSAGDHKIYLLLLVKAGSDIVSLMEDKITPFVERSTIF